MSDFITAMRQVEDAHNKALNEIMALGMRQEKYIRACYEVRMLLERGKTEDALKLLVPLTPQGNG